jgi:hypothetical protein
MADGYGVDPPYVPDREVFGAFTHQEIWDLVHEALDPAALGRVAAAWQEDAALVDEAFRTFADAVRREFERWSGRSGAAARQATAEFTEHGARVRDACLELHRLLAANADAAQSIRDALPPPPAPYAPAGDPADEAVHGGRRRMEHDIAAADALAAARDTMTYGYNPTLPASGDRVPRFAPPPAGPGSDEGHPA